LSVAVETRTRRPQARLWNATLAVIVLLSVTLQLWLLFTGGADANSGRIDSSLGIIERLVRFFSYFTIQSNLLVLATAITLALNPSRDGRFWRVLHLDALLGITITGLVFGTVLANLVQLTGLAHWVNIGFHYISPAMTVLGWLLFGPRPRISWSVIAQSFLWPVLWIVYTFAHGAITGWYPYPFLNPDKIGYPSALRNTALIFVGAAFLALALKALDRRMPATPS
jgi:hypothetical protein